MNLKNADDLQHKVFIAIAYFASYKQLWSMLQNCELLLKLPIRVDLV